MTNFLKEEKMAELATKLRKLKLSGMAHYFESRNRYAIDNNISYIEFLELLVEDEFVNRKSNSYRKRFSKSKLREDKTIEGYNFSFQPELNKKLILDLACCRFSVEKKNIVFMGNPGVGKTHLANAIGLEALKQGNKVLFIHCSELVEKLHQSKATGLYHQTLRQFVECDLLIIDELGFKKISYSDEFFEIIRRRYENGSIIITTNREFKDWGEIFGDTTLASAIIDRIIHHCFPVKITGQSFRIKETIKE
jgi:DNA replication protein DnaC